MLSTEKRKLTGGFTLIELLIVLGVSVALLTLAATSYRSFIARNQSLLLIQRVIDEIHFTRNAAVTMNKSVMLCGSSDGYHCDGNWNAGQIILFSDAGKILRRFPGVFKQYSLSWRSSLAKNNALVFMSTGFTEGQRGSFTLCSSTKQCNKVIVTLSGRARIV